MKRVDECNQRLPVKVTFVRTLKIKQVKTAIVTRGAVRVWGGGEGRRCLFSAKVRKVLELVYTSQLLNFQEFCKAIIKYILKN